MTLIGLDGKYLLTTFPKKMKGEEEEMAMSP